MQFFFFFETQKMIIPFSNEYSWTEIKRRKDDDYNETFQSFVEKKKSSLIKCTNLAGDDDQFGNSPTVDIFLV